MELSLSLASAQVPLLAPACQCHRIPHKLAPASCRAGGLRGPCVLWCRAERSHGCVRGGARQVGGVLASLTGPCVLGSSLSVVTTRDRATPGGALPALAGQAANTGSLPLTIPQASRDQQRPSSARWPSGRPHLQTQCPAPLQHRFRRCHGEAGWNRAGGHGESLGTCDSCL